MTAMATDLQAMDASIFFAQETNMAWTPTTMQVVNSQCNAIFKYKKFATSSSKEKSTLCYQPGGTLTLALRKWGSHVIACRQDELLGWWSYLELVGQQGKCIVMILAYCIAPNRLTQLQTQPQHNKAGSFNNMAWNHPTQSNNLSPT